MDLTELIEENKFGSTTYRPRNSVISYIWIFLIISLFIWTGFSLLFPALWNAVFHTYESYLEGVVAIIPWAIFGAIFFSLWLTFMWKARLVLVTFKNKHAFLSELNTALNGWQYSLPPLTRKKIDLPTPEKEKDFIIYKHAGMDPSIWIQAEDDNAKILGPNNTMKKLEKRLRQKPETCVIIGARL